MSDILFSTKIQNLLSESGYDTDSISTDEDGNSHRIKFQISWNKGVTYARDDKISGNKGVIYTEDGKIIMIEAEN